MPRAHHLTGLRFGRLVALERARPRGGRSFWICDCDCGVRKEIQQSHMVSGRIRSCGCLLAEFSKSLAHNGHMKKMGLARGDQIRKHGMSAHPVYMVWKTMRQRCLNPKSKDYVDYGARGVRIDPRWDSFEAFYSDMGERPEGMTLERKDNDVGYCPSNCVWASWSDQNANKRPRKDAGLNIAGKPVEAAQSATSHLECSGGCK